MKRNYWYISGVLFVVCVLACGWSSRLIAAEESGVLSDALVMHAQPSKQIVPQMVHIPHAAHVTEVPIVLPAPAQAAAIATPPPPSPTPSPTVQPTPPPTGIDALKQLIAGIFGQYTSQAYLIVNCESGFNPQAYNPTPVGDSHAEGLFQVLYTSTWNTTAQAANNPYDAAANAKAAYEIFSRDGYNWHEWACAAIVGLS